MCMINTSLSTLIERLKQVLSANDYKPGSQKARICEKHFLQGAISANPELINEYPAITICILSGRSILSLND